MLGRSEQVAKFKIELAKMLMPMKLTLAEVQK
jgi:hypothetical protein